MTWAVHTVVETAAYLASAKRAGMTEAEMSAVVTLIAADPSLGNLIKGSGGCRKVRVAGRGKGKSGGYRVVTYYADERSPVFLIAVLSKAAAANFTDAEVAAMAAAAKRLVARLGPKTIDGR